MKIIHNLSRLLILSNDHILLTKAHFKDGTAFFFLPGGHIEYNESVKQASIRELQEELNIPAESISEIKTIGAYEHSWDDKGEPYHEIGFISVYRIAGMTHETPPASNENHISFEWHSLTNLGQINLLPTHFQKLIPTWINSMSTSLNVFNSTMNSDIIRIQ